MNKLIFTLATTVCTAGLLLSSAMADPISSAYSGIFAPSTQVVDRNGKVVGNLLGPGQVIRKINGTWIWFTGVTRDGLVLGQPSNIFYTTANCSGTAYLDAASIPIVGYLVGTAGSETASNTGTIYYPAPPYRSLPITSRVVQAPTTQCEKVSPPLMIDVGVAKTMPLAVAPPLSVR